MIKQGIYNVFDKQTGKCIIQRGYPKDVCNAIGLGTDHVAHYARRQFCYKHRYRIDRVGDFDGNAWMHEWDETRMQILRGAMG